jgi:hypothetical protein
MEADRRARGQNTIVYGSFIAVVAMLIIILAFVLA